MSIQDKGSIGLVRYQNLLVGGITNFRLPPVKLCIGYSAEVKRKYKMIDIILLITLLSKMGET